MSMPFIAVAGVRPDDSSIGPPGNHLRWAFPPQMGFPTGGFAVYRRLSRPIQTVECLNLTKEQVLPDEIVPSGRDFQGVVFLYPDPGQIKGTGSELVIHPPNAELLELRFAQPMVCVRLSVRDITNQIQLHAYAGQQLVASSQTLNQTHRQGTLEVTAPFITRVTIPLQFTSLLEVCYRSLAAECRDKSWGRAPIVRLPLPRTGDEALQRLNGNGLTNRYVRDAGAANRHYRPEVKGLLDWLWLLQNPASERFVNPGARPDQLQLSAIDAEHPLQTIQPQSILLLAVLDPNIARLLSLYWVDVDGTPDGPLPGQAYDYKVEGLWRSRQQVSCGLVFSLGAIKAPLPQVHGLLEGAQLPGLRFKGKEPQGRVGLRWPRPKQGQGAVQPVLFDLARPVNRSRAILLTEAMPVLVPAAAWDEPNTSLFIESDVDLGKHVYRLRPIDLFGQVGDWIESELIEVQDLEAPPPPVRLRVTATQPGYPWRSDKQKAEPEKETVAVDLRFEYGDAQHRQAPDAESFQLYYRTESLFERQTVTATIQTTATLSDGLKVYTVQISGASESLRRFAGGILARRSATDVALPADQRLRFRIAEMLPDNHLKLAPTEETFTNGPYELTSDPHLRATWEPWGNPIPVHPELESLLKKVDTIFHARAAGVQTLGSEPNPLALLPAAHQPQSLADPPEHVEVLLDSELLEPDLFTGGTLQVGAQEFPILYATSGPAYNGKNETAAARLGLPPGSGVAQGDSLILKPDEHALVRVLWLEATDFSALQQTPGGEVAFDVVAEESRETLTYVARVMSAIQPQDDGGFSVLVRLLSPAALTALAAGVQRVRCYAPYRVTLQAKLGTAPTAGALPLPLPAGQSSQNLYLALTTSDPRKNESPLSAPAQVTAVKPPPTGAPARPYPCGPDSAVAAGYATPPDRQGRATLCLEWDTSELGDGDGLRYEVARALDNTILVTHRRNWLLGQIEIGAPVTGGIPLGGSLENIVLDPERGLYTADMKDVDLGVLAPADFRGGRLTQNGSPFDSHFQITAISAADNGALQVVLRPMAQGEPVAGDATLHSPPDYGAVRDDPDELRQLAAATPEAFSLVTGVPIRETHFRDEIPGIGRNCYFYRVRAVDAAENRSAWSEVSVPFYQVDTTPPEAPQVLAVRSGENYTRFLVLHRSEDRIVGYHLYRALTETDLDNLAALEPVKRFYFAPKDGQEQLAFAPILPSFGRVNLPLPASIESATVNHVYRKLEDGEPDDTLDLFVHHPTELKDRAIRDVNPVLPDSTAVVVVLRDDQNVLHVRNMSPQAPTPLLYADQMIDLRFPFTISEVVGVYRVYGFQGFDYLVQVEDQEPERNLVTDNTTYHASTHVITGLSSALQEDEPVVVVVKHQLADGTESVLILEHRAGSQHRLTFDGLKVELDTPLPSACVVDGIYRWEEYDHGRPANAQAAFNYIVAGSRFDPDMRGLFSLNPIVREDHRLIVVGNTARGETWTLDALPNQILIEDDGLPALSPGQYCHYRLTSIRRLHSASDAYLDIPSFPTDVFSVAVSASSRFDKEEE